MEAVKQNASAKTAVSSSHTVGRKAISGLAAPAHLPAVRIQPKLSVNEPGDKFEREADTVADKVMRRHAQEGLSIGPSENLSRSPVPSMISRKCAHCEEKEKNIQKKETQTNDPQKGRLNFLETELRNNKGGGNPLPAKTNDFMSRSIGSDFSKVRIHTGGKAAVMSKSIHAHAFTHGNDIYFNEGMYDPESDSGKRLLAHELTHVVQQGHAPSVNRHQDTAAAPSIQRLSLSDLTDLNPLDISIDDLVRKYMPELFDIKQAGGMLPWLEKKISGAVESMLKAASQPIKNATDFIGNLSPTLARIITWIKSAGGKISKNDCSSFTELGQMIEQLVDELAAPAIEKIKSFAKQASDWFSDIWQKFGLPVWDFIKQYIGDQWEMIKSLGALIWQKSEPIRNWAESVWIRFKNWLGIGDGPDGQNGILQWIEGKLIGFWNKIKEKVEPFKKQIMVVGGVLLLLSPAGPLIVAGAVFAGIISAVSWVRKNIQSPKDIVKLRVKFEKEILPVIVQGLSKASAALKGIFGGLTDKIGSITGALGKLVGLAADGILIIIQSILQWVTDKFTEIADWATVKLTELSDWLEGIFEKVRAFVTPIIRFFEKVSAVINDIMDLPALILGGLWNRVPACIRLPVQDFLINVILKNIPFFEDVVALVKYWQKIKQGAMDVIKTVFITGDLKGGILKAFKLFLDILGIPVQLVVGIYNKAVSAFDQIVNKPKIIFGNIVSAIKSGFNKFFGNFLKNSMDALGNWIFSKVKGIKMPKEFTVKSMFGLAMDILGFTEDNIFKRIEKKTSKPFADKLRKVYNGLKIAAKWVIQIFTDPKAAYEQAKEKVAGLKNTLFKSIGKWISTNIIGKFVAKMVAELASTPFGQAVEAIIAAYQFVQTAKEYAEKILRVIDSVLDGILDLAAGIINKAADTVEKGLVFGMEVAVAFIAKIVGIGELPQQVKKIIEEDIRPMVDSALDAVIDAVIGIVKSLKEFLGLTDKKDNKETSPEQLFKQDFSIGSEGHVVTARTEANKLIVTMASNQDLSLEQRILKAISSIQSDSNRDEKEKRIILKQLDPALVRVRQLRENYERHTDTKEIISFEAFVRPRITEIINFLRPLEKYNVDGIHDLISAPKKRRIPSGTKFDIRRNLYDKPTKGAWKSLSEQFKKGPVSAISQQCFTIKTLYNDKSDPRNKSSALAQWKDLKTNETIPSWAPPLKDYQHATDFGKFVYETDHKIPLGLYWNNRENNTNDGERAKSMLDTNNLQVLTDEANNRKSGVGFNRIVGPDFESMALYSPKNSTTIAGEAYEEGD